MKSLLTTTLAVAMLAGSSMAFAADNGNNNGGKNNNTTTVGDEQTGSIKSGTDSPDPIEMERCKTAPADDAKCAGMPRQ
jgi:hypothetical protein